MAYVDVTSDAHARVKIRVGNKETALTEDVKAARFHLDKSGEDQYGRLDRTVRRRQAGEGRAKGEGGAEGEGGKVAEEIHS